MFESVQNIKNKNVPVKVKANRQNEIQPSKLKNELKDSLTVPGKILSALFSSVLLNFSLLIKNPI